MVECDIMKNNKGQALVEFIIVMPILLLLIISIVDFGNIIVNKYKLENNIDIIVDMYENGDKNSINNYIYNNDLNLSYDMDGDFVIINIKKEVNIISPVVSIIFGNNYSVNTSNTVYKNE